MKIVFSKKVWWCLAVVCLVLVSVGGAVFFKKEKMVSVLVHDRVYTLEIADTEATRTLGLGNRESLCKTCGMLFVFKKEDQYSFWMRGMQFPLDIAWIDSDNRIVYLERHISEESTAIFRPPMPVALVLEVPTGALDAFSVGDRLVFQKGR